MTKTFAGVIAAAVSRFEAAGIEDAQLEAEALMARAADDTRARVLASGPDLLEPEVAAAYDEFVRRRVAYEPLAYITGWREFYGIDIRCDTRALIPRPETEMLVDLVLEELEQRGSGLRIVDVGTGTAAIAIAIAANNPDARVLAVDASPDALELAAENVAQCGLTDRVTVEAGDLLDGAGVADVVVANLPYVSRSDWLMLAPEVRDWEPSAALVGGEAGTEVIERLLVDAPAHLASQGILAMEVGASQAGAVIAMARASFPGADVQARKDLAGIERVVVVRSQTLSHRN